MVIACKEFEGASIVERIEVSEVGKLRWNWNGLSRFCPAIEQLHFVTTGPEGRSKVSQPDRLCPDGGLIEIPNGGLDEKGLHQSDEETSVNACLLVYFFQALQVYGIRLGL